LIGPYIGESEAALRRRFEDAGEEVRRHPNKPCILFIDEIVGLLFGNLKYPHISLLIGIASAQQNLCRFASVSTCCAAVDVDGRDGFPRSYNCGWGYQSS
jgi:hypothetical protein